MTDPTSPAIVLLSGGLDSTTAMAYAHAQTDWLIALSFDYGQRHAAELDAARKIAAHYHAEHLIVAIDLTSWGGSALTDPGIDVPKGRAVDDMSSSIPVTYVPARNTIFLAFATALAEVRGARRIFIGVNHLDYSGYPDCRPAFIAAFQVVANLATASATDRHVAVTIEAPLIKLSKAQIIRTGVQLDAPYELTWSCYDPQIRSQVENWTGTSITRRTYAACGQCDSCLLRAAGFREAGVDDPTPYMTVPA